MSDTLGTDQSPEHEWFYDAYNADPVIASLAYAATSGALFADPSVWQDHNHGRTQEYIGSVMAYYLSHASVGTLDKLDTEAPVTHWADVIKPPNGQVPDSVKDEIKEIRGFYVRESLQRGNGVSIHPQDLYLHLLWSGKVQAAAWYRKHMNDKLREGQQVASWDFSSEVISVRNNPLPGRSYGHYQNPYNGSLLGVISSLHLVGSDEKMPGKIITIDESINDMRRNQEESKRDQIQAESEISGVSVEVAGNILGLLAIKRAFGRARRIQEAWEKDPSVSSISSTRDLDTGKLRRLDVNGTVVIDSDRGVDLTSEPDWEQFARYKLVEPEALERMRSEREASNRRWACRPKLPPLSDDECSWHYDRLVHGL